LAAPRLLAAVISEDEQQVVPQSRAVEARILRR
jgi:hypothetical protein